MRVVYNKSELVAEQPRITEGLVVSSSYSPPSVMFHVSAMAKAIFAALILTLIQIAMAVLLLAPHGPLAYRYQTLIQHDSYWFANIVNRGYQTILPPIGHKMMEVSNTAFFPAYPAIAAGLRYGLKITTENALLVTAQAAAFGFWVYFFLFCQRWNVRGPIQVLAAATVAAHPAAFFLIAGYSESLFLMALLGFLYWSSSEGARAKVLAVLHGAVMSATRIVGLPCALAPLASRGWELGWRRIRDLKVWPAHFAKAVMVSGLGMIGGLAFFGYCQVRWGRWDIYMLTQQLGWGIEPDYLAVFRPSSYRWLLPALDNPTEASQLAMTLGGLLLVGALAAEFFAPGPTDRSVRVSFYFTAAVLYFISVAGVACVGMESMLRYEFCLHPLIVLALLHYLANVPVRSRLARGSAVAMVVLISAFGLALESWYLWNFTRGNWVA